MMPAMRTTRLLSTLALAAGLFGCGGAEDPTTTPPPSDDLLDPPAAGQGVQLRMTAEIGPGVEAELCQFVKAPAEGIYINRDEVRYTPGSHHFLLYLTSYDEIPTAKEDGTQVDTSGVFDCSDGPTNGWEVEKLVGGSQNADGTSMVSFPPDVAMHVRPGAVLLMNAHYVNASPETIQPEVAINLHSIPADQVREEGDLLFLYHPFIKVGAQSSRRARVRCQVRSDITISNVQSHMHARGVGYTASLSDGVPFYENDRWEGVPVKAFEGGFNVSAGEVLDYTCEYNNAGQTDIFQGPRSTDEMCMLIGSYYPADPLTASCAPEPEGPGDIPANLGGEWVGDGTATCAETMTCAQAAFATSFNDLQGCVADADPAVSKEASDFLRCVILSFSSGQDPMTACSAEITACSAK